jgi:hypothetical protein
MAHRGFSEKLGYHFLADPVPSLCRILVVERIKEWSVVQPSNEILKKERSDGKSSPEKRCAKGRILA